MNEKTSEPNLTGDPEAPSQSGPMSPEDWLKQTQTSMELAEKERQDAEAAVEQYKKDKKEAGDIIKAFKEALDAYENERSELVNRKEVVTKWARRESRCILEGMEEKKDVANRKIEEAWEAVKTARAELAEKETALKDAETKLAEWQGKRDRAREKLVNARKRKVTLEEVLTGLESAREKIEEARRDGSVGEAYYLFFTHFKPTTGEEASRIPKKLFDEIAKGLGLAHEDDEALQIVSTEDYRNELNNLWLDLYKAEKEVREQESKVAQLKSDLEQCQQTCREEEARFKGELANTLRELLTKGGM